jgi:hypothetical protein
MGYSEVRRYAGGKSDSMRAGLPTVRDEKQVRSPKSVDQLLPGHQPSLGLNQGDLFLTHWVEALRGVRFALKTA